MLDLRRSATILLTTLLPASLALAGCGGGSDDTLAGFDAVKVTGSAGEAPKLDWKGKLKAGKAQTKVIDHGDGEEVAKGDRVLVNYVVGDGWTHKTVVDTYGDKAGGFMTEVGKPGQPQQVEDLLNKVLRDKIEPGMQVGDRIAVTVGSNKLLDDYLGNAQVSQWAASNDIGNQDGLVIVGDIAAKVPAAVEGTSAKAPAWAPKVIEKKGEPARLDFTGVPKPGKKLEVATLVKGQGAPVESGDVVAVDYLGAVYQGKKPFDESYSRDEPFAAVLSEEFGTVVKGWSRGLIGVPAGSRVILEIPPKLGYGKKGSGKQIPPGSTLYFVVDVLAAA
ncbi:MAG TPA: FKBP-type peptidyl-prolyl cis-trans isomerase [Nocardioides sp.]|nr:FKBP-type peptidyl-prolyl cis-trans isomerase [Nocardioides sp.]